MLSGFQEILVLIFLILCIFIIPKFFNKGSNQKLLDGSYFIKNKISWKVRLMIVGSFFWLLIFALYLEPWVGYFKNYIILGIVPVILFWSIKWVGKGRS